MKISIVILLLVPFFKVFGQTKISGRYRDYFGSRIEINADSTFKYRWLFDMSSSWTKGTWHMENDTVYFKMIPVYDTVSYKNSDGSYVDKLVLSLDETPERLIEKSYVIMELSSGGQNIHPNPGKLYFRGQRLYNIKKRKIIKKKIKGFWSSKKWAPWFFKSDE